MPVKPALSGRDYTILHFNELGVFKGFGPWSDRSQAVPKQNEQAYLSLFAFTSPQCLHQTSVSPLLMLLFCSQDNLRLPWKARGALQTLAQPRFPQQRWPLPLVLYIYKWVFPWHPSILHILHTVLQVGMLAPLSRSQGAGVTGHSPQPFQNAQLNPGQSL